MGALQPGSGPRGNTAAGFLLPLRREKKKKLFRNLVVLYDIGQHHQDKYHNTTLQ